jgi:hypothetical protein
MAIIEAPFCFFQVQMECGIGDPFELGQPDFCKSPKSLDPIDVNAAPREFVLRMINSEVSISKVDKSVIAAPTIRIDDTRKQNLNS